MFEIVNNRQILFGENKIDTIASILKWYGKKKVFFTVSRTAATVTNHFKKITQDLIEAGIESVVYDKVVGEPDLFVINNGRDLFIKENCDCSIAFGGGSVIDAAKAINMLAVNDGNVEDYQMNGKQVTTTPPLFIAIPTTSGTGAEATKVSVVLNNYNGLKKSLYHNTMIADIAILDPTITLSLPEKITVATGMDTLTHGIESYVSKNANPITEIYSLKTISLIKKHFVNVFKNPSDLESRSGMMLASYLGGCAITAGIGIAHIMAQPLGAIYNIPHGDACSIFLVAAMELNLDYATKKYAKIAEALGVYDETLSDKENALAAINDVKLLRAQIKAPDSLIPYIKEEPSQDILIDTIKRTTGHITCNPKPLDEQLMLDAYNMVK